MGYRLQILAAALVLACAGPACAAPVSNQVVIVHGEESVAPAERGFALALARHAFRWYREAGVDATLGGDTRLADLLPGSRVAVLIQCANPTPAQLAALRQYVKGGGRLIVCYSMSPGLADLMGVQIGAYVRGDSSGRWSRMRFEAARPQGVPETVLQTSPNLFLVKPVNGASQVLAWWEDRAGQRTAEPAWLVCRNGYWMTHVLLADGDVDAKAQLLLALAASCDPSLWTVAADRKLAAARLTGSFRGPASIAAQARLVEDVQRRAVVLATAKAAIEADQAAMRARREGKGFAAWQQAGNLRRQMELAYGWMQAPRSGEIRAVWDHSGMGLYPGDWNRTCQLLKESGISDLYLCVGGAGFSHFRSNVLPPSRVFQEQGDQLAACLAAARPRGLRVHAWLFCFCTEMCTEDRMAIFRSRGWLLTGEDGRERRWLDPAVPEVRALLVQAARELATNYSVDGIHLDFVRYPDFVGSLGPTVRRRFEDATGRKSPDWPAEVKSGPRRAELVRWRCDRVTDLVADVRSMLRREGREKLLTAAVYGKYPSCVDAVGQDWEAWLRTGIIDYLLPMDYTEDPARFAELVGNQTRARWLRKHMLPGIGVTAAESRLSSAQVIDQIRMVREANCPGFALFDLDTYLGQDVLPVLRVGVSAK
ncbi:MAG: family 10 glycosylhydrolase [bacterium]